MAHTHAKGQSSQKKLRLEMDEADRITFLAYAVSKQAKLLAQSINDHGG